MATSIRLLQAEMSSLDWLTTKTLCFHIYVISHRKAFISILVPKLVAMVMSLCPLCTEVSAVNSLTAETLYQNQALHWNERIRLKLWPFCEISAYFGKIWFPWQRPLDLCNQKCLPWIERPRKRRVTSNHILAVSRTNAFIAILVPKLVAMVTPICPLCTDWLIE